MYRPRGGWWHIRQKDTFPLAVMFDPDLPQLHRYYWKYCGINVGPVSICQGGRRSTVDRKAHWLGAALLPWSPRLWCWNGPWVWEAHYSWRWPGRNGATYALVVICPGWTAINGPEALILPGGSAWRGPIYGGGDSRGSLFGMALHPFRTTGWLHESPVESHPVCLAVHDMW